MCVIDGNSRLQMQACPLCDIEGGIHVGKIEGIWADVVPVFWCAACELFYLSPTPTKNDIATLYSDNYWQHSRFKDVAKTFMRIMRVRDQVRFLTHSLGKITGKKILEVGAADARLISSFRHHNNITALEPNQRYSRYANQKYGIQLIGTDYFALRGTWDILLMSHVLEHFADPHAALIHAHSLLAERGSLFIEVPNSPLPGEVPSSELAHYLNTAHIVNFRLKSLDNILKSSGFSIHVAKRCSYNFKSCSGSAKKKYLKAALLGAMTPRFQDIPSLLRYVLSVTIDSHSAFQELPLTAPYDSYGDNLRVLALKK